MYAVVLCNGSFRVPVFCSKSFSFNPMLHAEDSCLFVILFGKFHKKDKLYPC